ncbi:cytochrome c biogenesis CcdA family protein [Candidatus Viridilinea mediisalina]|uniref:Cytochrome C biogenesis protein n=1 Tax=Candidatus Viridilinea mediisalina TaxID=2024553 RepID=A0A2A6RPE3_9CHLR|nr:cytochrome c biogenesis CcdA family protein [Candidatus Viridilinea mediisalina]PDW04771.1 cytochrome C biogenesis protein [Candidatus Viridilinea mediisalina]
MSTQPVETSASSGFSRRHLITLGVLSLLAFVIIILSLNSSAQTGYLTGGGPVLILALPVFLTGLLSFLSPCTLPILPAYFAVTFQAKRSSIFLMSLAFFFGLATTLTLLGGAISALSGLLFGLRHTLMLVGGIVIIIFGIMGIFGLGFAGMQINDRPATTLFGSYLYGATFALGWTACAGPLFGSFMTMLAASGNVAVLQGAVLAFIYASGLGLPLIFIATFFNRLGRGSRFWRMISGKGYPVTIFGREFYFHSVSVIGGLLMIGIGLLLATGQLELMTRMASSSSFGAWFAELEMGISRLFGLQ